jgi:hypothetical protein
MACIRYFTLIAFLFLIVGAVHAQDEETLLGGGFESGGYGAPVVKFTNVKGEFGVMVGGYGGWLINHAFMIGGGGYGLATRHLIHPASGTTNTPEDRRMQFGYGGGILEFIFSPKSVVHSTVTLLIGGGEVSMQDYWDDFNDFTHGYESQKDGLFVLEPSVNVEVNVTSFFRVNAGGSYRFVSGTNMFGLTNEDLSGASINLALKFGSF